MPGARPPHVALPSDPKSKACICRYAYDRDELERAGEEYASEGVDPAEASSLNRETRDATLEELLPATVRDSCRGANPGYSRTVLLQAFDWTSSKTGDAGWWRRLRAMAGDLASAGITHAWLPAFAVGEPEGYLPGKLFDLDRSAYGDKSELIALCEALTDVGIVPVCDVVINHRTADSVGPEGVYNVYDDLDPDGEPVSWGSWAITCDDPTFRGRGGPDSGKFTARRRISITPTRSFARRSRGGWRFLATIGLRRVSVRFRARVRHRVRRGVRPRHFRGRARLQAPTAFNVGENWVDMRWEGSTLSYDQDGPRRTLVDWIGATHGVCAAFDFPTKGILQRAVQHTEYWRLADPANRPPGLLGWVPERAVTFTDNHDTGYPQNHWPFPEDRQALGYAYVLTHPGVPCVYGPHLWDAANHPEWDSGGANLGEVIRALLAARHRADVRAESSVRILVAEADLYVARRRERTRRQTRTEVRNAAGNSSHANRSGPSRRAERTGRCGNARNTSRTRRRRSRAHEAAASLRGRRAAGRVARWRARRRTRSAVHRKLLRRVPRRRRRARRDGRRRGGGHVRERRRGNERGPHARTRGEGARATSAPRRKSASTTRPRHALRRRVLDT